MRKLKILAMLLAIMLTSLSFADYRSGKNFLATAYASISAGATYTKSSWTSAEELVLPTEKATITIIFTHDGSVGTAQEVDFFFQVSYDNGSTWTTDGYVEVDVETDDDHSSNIIRHAEPITGPGISQIRLYKVVNNDASTAITLVQATLSWGRRQ